MGPQQNPSSLGSTPRHRLFVPTCAADTPSRTGAVNDGQMPPPQAARSVVDGAERHGTIASGGMTKRNEKDSCSP
jgi:hypothetical protein